MEVQIGTNPTDPDTDGAELARGSDPLGPGTGEAAPAEEAAAEPAAAAQVEDEYESLTIGTVTDSSENSASDKLERLCTNDFSVSFRFMADDGSDEWKIVLEDSDDSTVTYVNLDDDETLEIGAPSNDFTLDPPADDDEEHRASIRFRRSKLSVSIDGKSIVSGHAVDSYDGCLHLKVGMHDGMTLSRLRVKHR